MTARVKVTNTIDDEVWDEFVAQNSFSQHEQTSGFARTRSKYYDCFRIKLLEGVDIVGGAQILVMNTRIGRVAELRHGPLFTDPTEAVSQLFCEELESFAKQNNVSRVRLMRMGGEEIVGRTLESQNFQPSEKRFSIGATSLVDIDRSDEDILAGCKKKTRYNIRYAAKKNVEVVPGNKEDLADFYRLHTLTSELKKFPVYPLEYFSYLWDLYSKHNKLSLMLAKHNGEVVAATVNIPYGSRLCSLWSGAARLSPDVKASYLLDWETILHARQLGLTEFDLCSIDLDSTTGPTAYKRSFGGYDFLYPDTVERYYGALPGLKRTVCAAALGNRLSRKIVNKVIQIEHPRLPF